MTAYFCRFWDVIFNFCISLIFCFFDASKLDVAYIKPSFQGNRKCLHKFVIFLFFFFSVSKKLFFVIYHVSFTTSESTYWLQKHSFLLKTLHLSNLLSLLFSKTFFSLWQKNLLVHFEKNILFVIEGEIFEREISSPMLIILVFNQSWMSEEEHSSL